MGFKNHETQRTNVFKSVVQPPSQMYIYSSWYTRQCRVNKVKKNHVVLVSRRHPLSAVVPRRHPLLHVTSRCHLDCPVVIRYYPLSPVTTPLGELTHAYAYCCIPFFMNYMHIKIQPSILMNKKVVKWGDLRPPARAASRALGHWPK